MEEMVVWLYDGEEELRESNKNSVLVEKKYGKGV